MGLKKYLPSVTQAVQVFIVMVVLTTFGIIARGKSFVGKFVGR